MSSENTVKLRVSLGFSYAINSYREEVIDTEISEEDWSEMSEKEREQAGEEIYVDWRANYLDGSWDVAE
ncbi:hypothetical protein HS041_12060 [Planomonospora sp. ID67723]|uniref:DUF7167 family protein n=1 Tax=Planomonospora sp. ID67723 TaxID=2738134 RepID=UPI0018C42C70|nr:hypothetical protein [Planomonospora sp. ID67723]MBG0828502.1 hypothetical protein [Planomonospora sp. ID67723]